MVSGALLRKNRPSNPRQPSRFNPELFKRWMDEGMAP